MKKFLGILLILTLLSLGGGSALAQEGDPPAEPTAEPTQEVTAEPTAEPTQEATAEPTAEPTQEPTAEPTAEPTDEVTPEPTDAVTAEPTDETTPESTTEPTAEPTVAVTETTTPESTTEPTVEATIAPTVEITTTPTVTTSVSAGEIDSQTLTNIPFTSKVAVMDISGAGANFSLSYYDNSGAGGAARGTNAGLSLSAFQMRLIDQATDSNITGGATLKGSAILQSNNPLASVVFFGGTGAGSYRQYEAYDSGGQAQPATKFFLPNAFRGVASGTSVNNSEIAIMNTDATTDAVVDILFVTDNKTKTINVKKNSTFYYNLEGETLISNNVRQPAVFNSRNGQKILVISTQYLYNNGTNKPVFVTKTAAFKSSDAGVRQYLPNIISQLNNTSVVHFVQNIGTSSVNISIDYIPDPSCGCADVANKTATLTPNSVFTVNPRTGDLPANWFGSAIVIQTSNTGTPSIVAFTNQLNTTTAGTSSGVSGRSAGNTGSTAYCPYFISGVPTFAASSSSSALQVQNVTGTGASINVSVTFRPGVGSPSSTAPAPTTFSLADGERRNFNARTGSTGGVPANWFGSVVLNTTTPGGKVTGIVNLFQRVTSKDDALGSYNCISP